jgi:hypothetical protein
MPAAGGESREIWRSTPGTVGFATAWRTPRHILFVAGGLSGPRALWRVPVDGGQPVRVNIPGDIMAGIQSSAGDLLAYETRAPRLELWALENVLPARK